MQFLHKMTTLRSFYGRRRNLLAGFIQCTSSIHTCDQISKETDMSDLWRSKILKKKEAIFLELLVKDGVSF